MAYDESGSNAKVITMLRDYLEDYESDVDITEGYKFNQPETINRIELYRASQFKSGNVDSQGNKKYFFNILNPQAGNATKNIDIDTQNVIIRSPDGKNVIKAMIAREALMDYMRRNKLGVFFNKISEFLPIYGSFVAKKTPDGIKYVPLKRVKFDPAVEDITRSPYIIEELYFSPIELETMKDKGWEHIDETVDWFRKQKDYSEICVFEVHCEAPRGWLTGWKEENYEADSDYVRAVFYISAQKDLVDVTKKKQFCKVLYAKEEKKPIYKKVNLFNIDGRSLGLGIFEMLFDAQERWNEIENQKASAMKLSSKRIFQTRDENIEGNILTDLVNGDIIKARSEITPVATEERNLPAYSEGQNRIMDVVRSNANAHEAITGEALPSGTPFRLGAMLNQNAGKLFEFIRENMGLFIKEIINDWILPDFKKEYGGEKIFELLDTETIQMVVEGDINNRLNEAIKKYTMVNGIFPTEEEVELVRGKMKDATKDRQFVKLVADYLNFDYDLEVVITGESYNIAQRVETASNILQLLAQNPMVAQDEGLRKIFMSIAEDVGFSPKLIPKKTGSMPALNQMPVGAPSAPAAFGGTTPMATQ